MIYIHQHLIFTMQGPIGLCVFEQPHSSRLLLLGDESSRCAGTSINAPNTLGQSSSTWDAMRRQGENAINGSRTRRSRKLKPTSHSCSLSSTVGAPYHIPGTL